MNYKILLYIIKYSICVFYFMFFVSELFPPQKIPDGALEPHRAVVRRKIVLYHNFFRTKVRPTASNMLLMVPNYIL